jgi:hypothetical protein
MSVVGNFVANRHLLRPMAGLDICMGALSFRKSAKAWQARILPALGITGLCRAPGAPFARSCGKTLAFSKA